MTRVVLDASALVALLRGEPGADLVRDRLEQAIISAVNYSEVLKKAVERGGSLEVVQDLIRNLALSIVPFDELAAAASAALYPATKEQGLSFADRACLALGMQRQCEVLTTERRMGALRLPIPVTLIRNAH